MSQTNGTANGKVTAPEDDGFNPVLLRLKQEAEEEVKRLRVELLEVRHTLVSTYQEQFAKQRLELRKSDLEEALAVAQRRLADELAAIRQHELATPPATARPSRATRELMEWLEAAGRILPEYAAKLDGLTQAALATELTAGKSAYHRAFVFRIGKEFLALSGPLKEWIAKLSAILDEGRLTEIQRMELLLRLTELEVKYETAGLLLDQLGVA